MKYLKYLFSSMLIAGALSLVGCGSKGSTSRDDGSRSGNVIKEQILDREINLDGVIRAYRTGAPMSNVQVTLIQLGKVRSTTTVDTNGHYAFTAVKVSSDQDNYDSAAENSYNAIQLEFKELKTKKLSGTNLVSGSDLYENGTTTPSYPESRLSLVLVTPDLGGPTLNAADQAAADQANNLTGSNITTLALTDAINEGRSYYFVDANTVRVRDVRLVQTGVLTGTLVDGDTGLPVAGGIVTISSEQYFRDNASGFWDIGGDVIAMWQTTRIISSVSSATGAFTFASAPAFDYGYDFNTSDDIHAEATGYSEGWDFTFADSSNIREDLVGSVGTYLIYPIKTTLKTVTMKFVDQNLAALAGVSVVFKFDSTETNASSYGNVLDNGLATDVRWVATSNASGVATVTVPNIGYNNAGTSQDFTAKKSGYKLDSTFTSIVIDDDDIKLNLSAFGGVDDAVDLGIIKMIPDTKKFASEFRVQLIYKEAPLVGATVTGIAKYIDSDVSAVAISLLISGDAVSDSNGFVTFNTSKIPASATGLSVAFTFDISLTGATSIVSALDGTYVVSDTDSLDLQELLYTDATVTTVASNDIHTITIIDKSSKLAGLEGYIVTGDRTIAATATVGSISYSELADVNLKLKVTYGTSVTSYFTTTDDNGYYAFLADDGVNIRLTKLTAAVVVGTNDLHLELFVLGDNIFSDGGDNKIVLEDAVGSDNGVDQIDTVAGVPGGTAWLWQLNEFFTGDNLDTKYDGQTLQVHTAAVEPAAALHLGFHVVSLVKTVAGVSTLSVIESDGTNKVYTYTQTQDDATGIQIIMSGALDETLAFQYNGLTGANLTPDTNTVHRLQIDAFDLTSGNIIPDGQTLTYTATASGRTITIIPSGNANKFETQVTYKLLVRAVNAAGEVSDDFLFFRFYNHENEIFSTEKPSVDVSTMTTGDYWYLHNNIAGEADNYKLALNDANGVFATNEVHFLLYSNPTGFGFATGSIQNEAFDINDLKLTFAVPTDLRTAATANTNIATVVTELADFEVWAQAYTVGGVILQHWTNVSTAANASVGNNFDLAFAGKMKIGLTIFGNSAPNIFEKALAEGNKVDLTVVHKNSQIDPSAAKCLTLSLADHAGVQAKSVTIGAATYVVTLSENVTAVAATVPTMTTAVHGITLSNVRYTLANEITADSALTFTSGTDIATSPASSIGSTSANWVGDIQPSGDSQLVLGTTASGAPATMATYGNELRVGRTMRFDNDGAAVATASVNGAISSHSSLSFATIPIITGLSGAGAHDFNYSAIGTVVAETAGDGSTATRVDIDQTGGAAILATGLMSGRTYDILYANVTAGSALRTVLENIVVGDILSVSGSNFYLVVTGIAANTISVTEDGLATANVRTPLGYDASQSTGANLILAPQIRFAPTSAVAGDDESDDNASGIADALPNGADATTGVRGATNNSYTAITSTMIKITGVVQLYPGDSVVLLTDSATATDGNEPVYSAVVVGSKVDAANTVVVLSTVTQIRGTTEAFTAGGQTAHTNGFVFFGDSVTIGLGTGIVSVMSGAPVNTNGDAVSSSAFTDDTNVQDDTTTTAPGGEGFSGVK